MDVDRIYVVSYTKYVDFMLKHTLNGVRNRM